MTKIKFAMSKDRKSTLNRRSFLKQAGIGSTALASGILGIGPVFSGSVAAYSETDYVWRKEDGTREDSSSSGRGKDYASNLGASLVYYGTYENGSNEYLHQFDESAHTLSREKNSWEDEFYEFDDILKHTVTMDNHQESTSSIFTPDNERDVGSTPVPDGDGNSSNFGDAAYTALKGAIGVLHPALGAGIAASEVVAALWNDDESEPSGDTIEYPWYYGSTNKPADADHYIGYYIESDDRESYHTVEAFMATDVSYHSNSVGWDIYIDPYNNLSTFDNKSTDQRTELIEPDREPVVIPNRKIPKGSPLHEFANGGPLRKHALPVLLREL